MPTVRDKMPDGIFVLGDEQEKSVFFNFGTVYFVVVLIKFR
jgi:hypothetical protein